MPGGRTAGADWGHRRPVDASGHLRRSGDKAFLSIHFAHNPVAVSSLCPHTPAFRHSVHRLRDPEEFDIAVSGVRLTADFLAPQKEATITEQFQAPDWAFDFHEAHVKARIRGPVPHGWMSIGFMHGLGASAWYGVPAEAGTLACTPPGDSIDGCFSPGFVCTSLSMPFSVWERCRAIAGAESPFGSGTVLQLPPPIFARLRRQLEESRTFLREASLRVEHSASAVATAASLAADLATTAWELFAGAPPPRASFHNRARLARRAEAWMRDRLAEPVRIPDLCLALRVSRRELEYAFRSVFDQSPRDFLHALRLNAIRHALRQAGRSGRKQTLLELELAHGVTHAGRFAAQYRELFGESPARTRMAGSGLAPRDSIA